MLDRIRALPGVTAAGATGRLPLAGVAVEAIPLRIEGRAFRPNALPPLAEMRVATPGYFEAMGIPTLAGRTLERSDTEQRHRRGARDGDGRAEADGVAPARRRARGARTCRRSRREAMVGRRGRRRRRARHFARQGADGGGLLRDDQSARVDMDWLARSMVYAVRTTAAPGVVIAAVRRELAQIDPTLPLAETRTLSSVVAGAQSGMRFSMIGFCSRGDHRSVHGRDRTVRRVVVRDRAAHARDRRAHRVGRDAVVGARRVLRRGLAVSAAGLIVGMIGALLMRGLATPLLYGITPTDPLTLIAVSCALLLVGALATWLPARRAARLDPVMALRGE